MSEYWQEVTDECTDYYLELLSPDKMWRARIKMDGCFEFERAHNRPFPELPEPTNQMIDGIHICDIDNCIARLQELKRLALAKFGREFWTE